MKEWLRDVLLAPKPWGPLGQKLMQLKAGENFIPRRLKAALGITAMTSGILPVLSGWSGRDGLVERPLHADYVGEICSIVREVVSPTILSKVNNL